MDDFSDSLKELSKENRKRKKVLVKLSSNKLVHDPQLYINNSIEDLSFPTFEVSGR
jgi:hypothetical protein